MNDILSDFVDREFRRAMGFLATLSISAEPSEPLTIEKIKAVIDSLPPPPPPNPPPLPFVNKFT